VDAQAGPTGALVVIVANSSCLLRRTPAGFWGLNVPVAQYACSQVGQLLANRDSALEQGHVHALKWVAEVLSFLGLGKYEHNIICDKVM